MARKQQRGAKPLSREAAAVSAPLRIIGGRFRGRLLAYEGDPRTRPMKDRTREAVFNLLGPFVVGKHAIDLFAGTGALGLEALSRGAAKATLIERHFPTARIIRKSIEELGVGQQADVVAADAFIWARRLPDGAPPWVVFCSPPYDFYVERAEEMLQLIDRIVRSAPPESAVVVESDERFDVGRLPAADCWDVRCYRPASIAILYPPCN
jgi:16S rRNA (guanine(966)-N(2))-methyltransferase RsmD